MAHTNHRSGMDDAWGLDNIQDRKIRRVEHELRVFNQRRSDHVLRGAVWLSGHLGICLGVRCLLGLATKEEEQEVILPSLTMELYYNTASQFEFFGAMYDEDGRPWFPFGGTRAQQHGRSEPDVWRVHIFSPFPGKGFIPLKHPRHGYLMTKEQAIEFAMKMQP